SIVLILESMFFYGSINTQLAEKTGFTNEDAEMMKNALVPLIENDASAARPEGIIEVHRVCWWDHIVQNLVNTPLQKYIVY
ncbi:type I CRISPR-associated protein Cas7, partial [Bacillus thuringiensis]|nr:type I CRISPR-associated protein Cas7 [Bacillus thuringiensis]